MNITRAEKKEKQKKTIKVGRKKSKAMQEKYDEKL